MSDFMEPVRGCAWLRGKSLLLLYSSMITLSTAGCASMSQDVDRYYRQMEFNYKEAQEKAKLQEASLQRQSSVLAAVGDVKKAQKAQKEIERLKAWEAKCAKEEKRFEKAAQWTEEHFHLEKPAIAGEPTSLRPANEGVSSQPLESPNP
jgi:ATPase subunit of ABC transporter with duplicated ATPase domains